MIGDFNIRDNDWDLTYPYHSVYSNVLMEVVNSFDLKLSTPVHQVPTVKIVDGGLYFIFSFHFYFTFHFFFFFIFLFLEQLGLGFISHAVTSVTN